MKTFNTLPMRAESHFKILALLSAVAAVGLLVFFVADAQADPDKSSELIVQNANQLINTVVTSASKWSVKIKDVAAWLFWTLATISMTWTFGLMALRKADLGEFFAEFIRFAMFTGFYWWLLDNGPSFAMMLFDSLAQLAGKTVDFDPNKGVDYLKFLQLAFQVFQHVHAKLLTGGTPTMDQMFMMGSVMAIVIMMTQVAMAMVLLFLSCFLLAFVGVFVLGFGGARWTSDIAINYYKTALGFAVQYFVMLLLVGVMGGPLVEIVEKNIGKDTNVLDLNIMFMVLMISVVFFMLLSKVPPLIAGVISGANMGSSQFAGAAGGGAMSQFSSSALRSAGGGSMAGGGASMFGGGGSMLGGALGGSALAMSALLSAMRNIAASEGVSIPSIPGVDGGDGANNQEASAASSGTPLANAAGFSSANASGGFPEMGANVGSSGGGKEKSDGGSGAKEESQAGDGSGDGKPNAGDDSGGAGKAGKTGSGSSGQSGMSAMTQSAKNAAKETAQPRMPSQLNTSAGSRTSAASVSEASRQGGSVQIEKNTVSQETLAPTAGASQPGSENSTLVDQNTSPVDHGDTSSVDDSNEEVLAFMNKGDNNNLA